MGDTTAIAWTEHTFNAWVGCLKISPGCAKCYAETLVSGRMGRKGLWGPASTAKRERTTEANWRKPLLWQKQAAAAFERRRVFCGSLMDWAEDHPQAIAALPSLWKVIRRTPNLDWQLLTKRAERIERSLPADWDDGYPNVWLGVSIESQAYAERADHLRGIPAAVRFISYEPALGPLRLDLDGIDWVIFGGESGPGYRGMDPQWARDMRADCERAGVAFFFKQSAAPRTEMGTTLDGETVRAYPIPRVKRRASALA